MEQQCRSLYADGANIDASLTRRSRRPTGNVGNATRGRCPAGIVKLFGNGCGAVDVSGIGWRKVMADCVFQTAPAVMTWFQTAKRLIISVRHSGALIR